MAVASAQRFLFVVLFSTVFFMLAFSSQVDAKTVSAGNKHTCAIVGGGIKCWGNNIGGQLGDGTNNNATYPVSAGALTGATDVSSGDNHTCAVAGGNGYCWGFNNYGVLGTGTPDDQTTPTPVVGLGAGTVTAVSTAFANTCFVIDGAAKCWGYNYAGQVGNDSTVSVDVPTQVVGLTSGVTDIDAWGMGTCAIVNGGAWCWGGGYSGQLGNGSGSDSDVPVQVTGLTSGVTDISVGFGYACAVVSGAAKCWGSNSNGRLGNGNTSNQTTPAQVVGLESGVTSIDAGEDHTCAVVNGATKCWGYSFRGGVGNGEPYGFESSTPVDVVGLSSGSSEVSVGGWHTCGLAPNLKCWGWATAGQLGDGRQISMTTPVDVILTPPVVPPVTYVPPGDGEAVVLPKITKAPATAKPGKAISLTVSCPKGCALNLALKIGSKNIRGLKSATVAPGDTSVSIKLPSKVVKQVRAALKKNKKTRAVLTIKSTSPSGTGNFKRVRIK